MCGDVHITSPSATLKDAARIMREADAGSVPVGENDRLVGMITDRDIAVRGVAEGLGADAPVRQVMTSEIHYVFDDEALDAASKKMSELKVRRLPVLNREKRLVGILSLGDMARGARGSEAHSALSGVTQPGGPHA
jgi:CBS domain-containing protein